MNSTLLLLDPSISDNNNNSITLDNNDHDNNTAMEELFQGVPSSYDDLFATLVFLLMLFVMGDVICRRLFRIVPSLVGFIVTGIIMGPEGLDYIPMPEAWVLLGNLGLVLLLTQAGLEMDWELLPIIGVRGCVMALVGSIFPISLGMLLTWGLLDPTDSTTILAMGCCFGPTSAGIAINVLGQCHVLETPIGQLIVAAAIVDDILALLVLSLLQALTTDNGDGTVIADIVIPIVSAFAWLFLGGALALFVVPTVNNHLYVWTTTNPLPVRIIHLFRLYSDDDDNDEKADTKDIASSNNSTLHTTLALNNTVEDVTVPENPPTTTFANTLENDVIANSGDKNDDTYAIDDNKAAFSLITLLGLVFALLPATSYTKASYLLGAFLAGLAFCQEPNVDKHFARQFKRVIQWCMRLFFAATIGFQVPVSLLFGDDWEQVIGNGFLLSLALLGKVAVGPLLTPNLDKSTKAFWTKCHVRNCAIVSFSMAGEAEFAFVMAVFGLNQGLIPPDLYASVVFAILISTLISPLLLRFVLYIYPYESNETTIQQDEGQTKGEEIVTKSIPTNEIAGDEAMTVQPTTTSHAQSLQQVE